MSPGPIAYNLLGVDDDANKGAVEFMHILVKIEEALYDLEDDVSNYKVGLTGFSAFSELKELERTHSKLAKEIDEARRALINHNWSKPRRFDSSYYARHSTQELIDNIPKYRSQIERLERLSDRIGNQISSMRNSPNARASGAVSAVAVSVSTISVILSAAVIILSVSDVI